VRKICLRQRSPAAGVPKEGCGVGLHGPIIYVSIWRIRSGPVLWPA
jgi:hypothetical protein